MGASFFPPGVVTVALDQTDCDDVTPHFDPVSALIQTKDPLHQQEVSASAKVGRRARCQ
jgi:hypothetical protein